MISDMIDKEVAELLPCPTQAACAAYDAWSKEGHLTRCPGVFRPVVAAWARKREAELQNQIEQLWREINQYEMKPDEDGACLRCGLIWQEPDTTEEHICPPGFWRPEEAELAALREENARLKAPCLCGLDRMKHTLNKK